MEWKTVWRTVVRQIREKRVVYRSGSFCPTRGRTGLRHLPALASGCGGPPGCERWSKSIPCAQVTYAVNTRSISADLRPSPYHCAIMAHLVFSFRCLYSSTEYPRLYKQDRIAASTVRWRDIILDATIVDANATPAVENAIRALPP